MKIIFILTLVAWVMAKLHLYPFLTSIGLRMQFACLSRFSNPIENLFLLEAFACGQSLNDGPSRSLWVQTSLYHLLVVSGGHLIFLETLLNAVEQTLEKSGLVSRRISKLLFFGVLMAFTLMTGFQPPLVRALIARGISFFSNSFKMNWTLPQVISFSGIACLLLAPDWLNSRSLLMSWMSALALTLSKSAWGKATAVFVLLIPCLWGWGQLHPLGILINVFAGTAIASLLALAITFYFVWPHISEKILQLIVFILRHLAEVIPTPQTGEKLNLLLVWGCLILFSALIHGRNIVRRRIQWQWGQ